jgi:hypothetical protein
VDHVELLGGILASARQYGQFLARVILEEVNDIKHLPINKDPAFWLGCVLRRILHGEATSVTAIASCRCAYRASCASLVHQSSYEFAA